MRSRRILDRLTWLAAAPSPGHPLDHLIHHDAVGWWLDSGSRPGPAQGVASVMTGSLAISGLSRRCRGPVRLPADVTARCRAICPRTKRRLGARADLPSQHHPSRLGGGHDALIRDPASLARSRDSPRRRQGRSSWLRCGRCTVDLARRVCPTSNEEQVAHPPGPLLTRGSRTAKETTGVAPLRQRRRPRRRTHQPL
jgi:hypothetical protein